VTGQPAPKAFAIAAAALALSMVGGAFALFFEEHDTVVYLTLAQGALYAVFAWLLWRDRRQLTERQNQRYLYYLIGLAIFMRALLLFAPPHSTDIYRYIWDGRVQADGINPYRYIPAGPALAHLRDSAIYENVNRKEYAPTIYPPMAQAVFFLASRVSESVAMMKAAMLAFEALAIFALIELLRARRLPTVLVSLYALHPLAIWEIAGSGHVDIIAIACMLLALLAAEKGMRFASGAALAAGVLTKYFPLVLAPAIYRRWDWRMPAAFAATAFLLYVPYLSAGTKVFGFLGGYAGEELRAGDGLYIAALLKQFGFGAAALPVFFALATLTLVSIALRSGFRSDPGKPDLSGAFSAAIAFTVFFSPHYAWYFLWLVPFLCFFPRPSVFWLTLSATALYRLQWPLSLIGASVQYAPFAALLILENLKLFSEKETSNERALA
jgi:hypothetical protein